MFIFIENNSAFELIYSLVGINEKNVNAINFFSVGFFLSYPIKMINSRMTNICIKDSALNYNFTLFHLTLFQAICSKIIIENFYLGLAFSYIINNINKGIPLFQILF